MTGFQVLPLHVEAWPAFADLVTRGGVWGGCWCLGFHPEGGGVRGFDGDVCDGWCQFGDPEELARIKFGKVDKSVPSALPDWRITCFYTGKKHRHAGVADVALGGALRVIAELGGGRVESSPEDVTDWKVSNSFLYNSTTSIFERHGFERVRPLGEQWLVTKSVSAAP